MTIEVMNLGWNVNEVTPEEVVKNVASEMDFDCEDYDTTRPINLSNQDCGLEDRVDR